MLGICQNIIQGNNDCQEKIGSSLRSTINRGNVRNNMIVVKTNVNFRYFNAYLSINGHNFKTIVVNDVTVTPLRYHKHILKNLNPPLRLRLEPLKPIYFIAKPPIITPHVRYSQDFGDDVFIICIIFDVFIFISVIKHSAFFNSCNVKSNF